MHIWYKNFTFKVKYVFVYFNEKYFSLEIMQRGHFLVVL